MQLSAFGSALPESEIVFEPIATTTPAERISILSQFSATLISLYQSGLMSQSSALSELQTLGKELGAFFQLEPGTPPQPAPQPANIPNTSTNLASENIALLLCSANNIIKSPER